MLNKFKKMFSGEELLKGNYGIERESIRVDKEGNLSKTPHPKTFGCRLDNPYITTDFAENQVEIITPALSSVEETYNFLNTLYDIVVMEIGDELLWPQSMPPVIKDEKEIAVASFCECSGGTPMKKYREYLLKKYGGKKQLISGIHYNFSYDENIIKKLYEVDENAIGYKDFKNNLYLKVARNFLRYRWLITYLMGASSSVHDSFFNKDNTTTNNNILSYRNSKDGYGNGVQLYPSYDSVEDYISSISKFIDDKCIDSFKELYSQVRLKPKNKEKFKESLEEDGILYLEYRNIDINPFDKCGITLFDMEFMQVFNLYLLLKEESNYKNWQQDGDYNQNMIATAGLRDINLLNDGVEVDKNKWALDIIDELVTINETLNLNRSDALMSAKSRINNVEETYAFKFKQSIYNNSYNDVSINLAKAYKKDAYNNRFKLRGYEDLELSTQILIKESIKQGLKVDIIDRSENFIAISNKCKTECVKQATKTSKDNYVTVLMMENKVVTKKVLGKAEIRVPSGYEFYSIEEAMKNLNKIINKPIVIKPKSTNFGTGISIFPSGAGNVDIENALKIAFNYDDTVLVEEFIKGKEYRFLVVDDRVVGILHRVPANVKGDGKSTIKDLVSIKNEDPLRGYHYRTPLEKIKLDDNAMLFLKQQNIDERYIPKSEEIIYLRENSNISTGGDSIDYTDLIPQKFKDIAVKCSKAIGARICGVDMIIEDYSNENSNYAIIELNFNPAIHIHSYPYKGKERKIAYEILKLLDFVR